MNRWKELVDTHKIHETIKHIKEIINIPFDDVDKNESSEKRRFLKLIYKIENSLEKADPELIPLNELNALNTKIINNVEDQINEYKLTGSFVHLIEANNQLTPVLMELGIILSLTENSPIIQPVKDLEKLIDESINSLVGKKDEMSSNIDKISNLIDEKAILIDKKSKELEDLSTRVELKNQELNNQFSGWQNQFSTAQENRSQEFSKWRDSFASEKNSLINEVIKNHEQYIINEESSFQTKINIIIEDSNIKHKAILELYELTASDSVAAGYIKSANEEKSQADNWRLISLLFICITVCWLFYAYLSSNQVSTVQHEIVKESDNTLNTIATTSTIKTPEAIKKEKTKDFPWYHLVVTFSLTGVLLWGSSYAAQQSTKHRNNERKTRWFALEIKAFDPFVSSLNIEQQAKLKRKLTERIFGQNSNSTDDTTTVIDEHMLKTVTDAIGTILTKLPK
jgi:hypothetical protein